MSFDPEERRDENAKANPAYDSMAEPGEQDEQDEQTEQLVRDAFAALPVVPCPDDVVRRIEQAVTESESQLGAAVTTTGRHRAPIRWLPTIAGLAAAAAIAWLLIAQPTQRNGPTVQQVDSTEATREVRQGLALATQMLQRSEQILLEEAFVKPLPGAVRNSLRKTVSLVQGGRG